MKRIFAFIITIILSFVPFACYTADVQNANNTENQTKVLDPKNTLYIELKDGIVIAELFPTKAPLHVQRIKTLTGEGFYDGVKFHRVIDGFMAQTGDPTGTGRGGSRLGRLYAEFNDEHHTRGTLSMARASDPNSANSQFFIVTGDFFPELDGQYTVFGRVIEGMDFVDKIKGGDTSKNGMVENPDVMIKVVSGDMLNNKSLKTIKEEIRVINELQNQKLKEDPNYKKQSVLDILLQTKNVDSTEVEEPKTEETKDGEEQQKPVETTTTTTTTITNSQDGDVSQSTTTTTTTTNTDTPDAQSNTAN